VTYFDPNTSDSFHTRRGLFVKRGELVRMSTSQPRSTAVAADFVAVPLWKRALDIFCLLIAIPVLLPLIVMTIVITKVGSRGPLLFKQERVGLQGKRFILFKFRTMNPGADTAVHEEHVANLMKTDRPMTKLDTNGDARLIPFGRQLRAVGLDELPQLINVLRGEMSIVGPRPCLPAEYERHLPRQKERFRTLPGLTGLWQVSGKNRTTFNEMIELDIRYVQARSPWLDLKIMLQTIPAVIVEAKRAGAGRQGNLVLRQNPRQLGPSAAGAPGALIGPAGVGSTVTHTAERRGRLNAGAMHSEDGSMGN
jgi:lipopolysaccharide/colanic/teichoic acid biosynthesis glycosyltransferase